MKSFAVMGHGVVGSGVCEIFVKNKLNLEKKLGCALELRRVLDLRAFEGLPYSDRFTTSFDEILNDPQISVVAEVLGGLEPAFSFVKALLCAGKSVVTSNKELVAEKGAELLALAKAHDVNFLFEASVGGGIPIIRPLHQCLAANRIEEIEGILNGTTNFILTKMIRENMTFDEALSLAQRLGYAEKNPAADVEGHDACRKICILASLAFGKHIYPKQVQCEGITKITAEDVAYCANWGGVIKLIGRAARTEGDEIEIGVFPRFVSHESQLANVEDVFNAVLVKGDATGEVVFYGKGAGKLPTGSAVMADIMDCFKATGTIVSLGWEDSTRNMVRSQGKSVCAMYVRLDCSEAAPAQVEQALGACKELHRKGQPATEMAFITRPQPEEDVFEALETLSATHGTRVLGAIRLLDEEVCTVD